MELAAWLFQSFVSPQEEEREVFFSYRVEIKEEQKVQETKSSPSESLQLKDFSKSAEKPQETSQNAGHQD